MSHSARNSNAGGGRPTSRQSLRSDGGATLGNGGGSGDHPLPSARNSNAAGGGGARSARGSMGRSGDWGASTAGGGGESVSGSAAGGASSEAVAALEFEVAQQRQLLQDFERRAAHLETEVQLAAAAASRAEEAHAEELKRAQRDMQLALGERRALLDKLRGVEVIEDAVRELYVQMKDRTAEDEPPTPEQLQAEKEALRAENVLVVLGSLHAVLRNLWAFKVEAEEDMRGRVDLRGARGQAEALELKQEIRTMEAALRHAGAEAGHHKQRSEEEAAARQALLAESRIQLEAMALAQAELIDTLKATHGQGESYKKAMQLAYDEGRKRDGLVLRNKQLESARHFDRVAQDKELRKMQYEHNFQLASAGKELERVGDLLARNALLEEQLATAQAAAASYKREALEREEAKQTNGRTSARNGRGGPGGLRQSWSPGMPLPAAALRASSFNATDPTAGGLGQQGGTGMSRRAAELLEGMRLKTAQQARADQEKQEERDPIYGILGNVSKMHKAARASLKDLKRDVGDSALTLRARINAAAAAGAEYSATAALTSRSSPDVARTSSPHAPPLTPRGGR